MTKGKTVVHVDVGERQIEDIQGIDVIVTTKDNTRILYDKWYMTEQEEPCEDEYIKVPKKALKYRTAGMVAYNVEWLKNHFDIERTVICGAQEPCGETVSLEAFKQVMWERDIAIDQLKELGYGFGQKIEPCGDAISREAVLSLPRNRTYELSGVSKNESIDVDLIEALPSVNPQEHSRDMEEIAEIMRCDADAETKCKMISNILTTKPHYFEEQEPITDRIEYGTDGNAYRLTISNGKEFNQKPKMGRWIIYDVHGHKACKCSECGMDVGYPCNDKHCKYCGIKMQEVEE